jgi:hypothetical protein|tara:strand:- start:10553 stop:10780 length:228 start_codon:yes stop_codon:yes gene_type:complete
MKLEETELNFIKESTAKLNSAKAMLGDIEIKKHELLLEVDGLKVQFQLKEKELIEKYGLNSVINMQTGEVKQKEE